MMTQHVRTALAGGRRATRRVVRELEARVRRWSARLTVALGGLALAAGVLANSLSAQATGGGRGNPQYRGLVCENGGRTGSAEFTDSEGNVHQLWYEHYGFRTGIPDDPGGWFEMGKSVSGSQLPKDHRVSGAFDDNDHTLNGMPHSAQEDLDHAHAFNMMQGLLNICLNTEN